MLIGGQDVPPAQFVRRFKIMYDHDRNYKYLIAFFSPPIDSYRPLPKAPAEPRELPKVVPANSDIESTAFFLIIAF